MSSKSKILNCPGKMLYPVEYGRTIHCGAIVEFDTDIDVQDLKIALDNTLKCYPMLNCGEVIEDDIAFLVDNDEPVPIIKSPFGVCPMSEIANNHLLGLSYYKNAIRFVVSHVLTDGGGFMMALRTLVYYYCVERYGNDFEMPYLVSLKNQHKNEQMFNYFDLDYGDVDLGVLDNNYGDGAIIDLKNFCARLHDAKTRDIFHETIISVDAQKFVALSKSLNASPAIAASIISSKAVYEAKNSISEKCTNCNDIFDNNNDIIFRVRVTVDGRQALKLPFSMFNCSFAAHLQVNESDVQNSDSMTELGSVLRTQLKEQTTPEYVKAQAKSFVDAGAFVGIPPVSMTVSYLGIADFGEANKHINNFQLIEGDAKKLNMYQWKDKMIFVFHLNDTAKEVPAEFCNVLNSFGIETKIVADMDIEDELTR